MLCSTSTSNWLQRLHISKGFSIPAHLHLDHFITPNPNLLHPLPNDPSDPRPPACRKKRPPPQTDDRHQRIFHIVGGVLAELFVMGGSPVGRALEPRKSARKQPNPRACVPSASGSIDGRRAPAATSPPSSADNSVAEAKKSRTKLRRKRGTAWGPVDLDLSACSRTDVTVIDTSCPGWKTEKIILRKGMLWKVRDKKVWNLNRKKRKLGLVGRLVCEKEKEQPLAEPRAPAEEELFASVEGSAPVHKRDASEKIDDQVPISIRRKNGASCPKVSPKGR